MKREGQGEGGEHCEGKRRTGEQRWGCNSEGQRVMAGFACSCACLLCEKEIEGGRENSYANFSVCAYECLCVFLPLYLVHSLYVCTVVSMNG